jgi:hypothetical protein
VPRGAVLNNQCPSKPLAPVSSTGRVRAALLSSTSRDPSFTTAKIARSSLVMRGRQLRRAGSSRVSKTSPDASRAPSTMGTRQDPLSLGRGSRRVQVVARMKPRQGAGEASPVLDPRSCPPSVRFARTPTTDRAWRVRPELCGLGPRGTRPLSTRCLQALRWEALPGQGPYDHRRGVGCSVDPTLRSSPRLPAPGERETLEDVT